MILLDLDNLNILVLFILAFISFKSYQGDHHAIESESESEIQQTDQVQTDLQKEQEEQEISQLKSQKQPEQQLVAEAQIQAQTDKLQSQELSQMISEELIQTQENPENLQVDQTQIQPVQAAKNYDTETGILQNQNQLDQVIQNTKCDQEIQDQQSLKNPESDSYSDEAEDEDEEKDSTALPREKIKKIRKFGKKGRRDLIRQNELQHVLAEEIEIQ